MSDISRRHFLEKSGIGASLAGLAVPAAGSNASGIELVREQPGGSRSEIARLWTSVLTHTHRWRWPRDRATVPFEDAQRQLAEWCAQLGVRASGIGSAWEPVSLASYLRYEGPDRDLYYSGRVDPRTVMDTDAVYGLIDQLNRLARGRTLFYLDNETPKGATCHVWWFGYHYDFPAWHDYSQDRPIRLFLNDTDIELNALTGQPHTRRTLFEIMAAQHAAGALGVFAHPTRWWTTGNRYFTNVAAFAPLFLAVYGRLDGLAVMGDGAFNQEYQRLWFHFLDSGAQVPGFAETDIALNAGPKQTARDTLLNYMPLSARPSVKGIVANARNGRSFASNGPLVTLEVDGRPMGSVVRTSAGKQHQLEITAYPAPDEQMIGRVEVVSNGGQVLAARENLRGGRLTYRLAGRSEPGWVVVRVFGEQDAPGESVRYHALTNPVYLYPEGFRTSVAMTVCRIRVEPQSNWLNGDLEFQDPKGSVIRHHTVRQGVIEESVPADTQVVVRKGGMRELRFFIALENEVVRKRATIPDAGGLPPRLSGITARPTAGRSVRSVRDPQGFTVFLIHAIDDEDHSRYFLRKSMAAGVSGCWQYTVKWPRAHWYRGEEISLDQELRQNEKSHSPFSQAGSHHSDCGSRVSRPDAACPERARRIGGACRRDSVHQRREPLLCGQPAAARAEPAHQAAAGQRAAGRLAAAPVDPGDKGILGQAGGDQPVLQVRRQRVDQPGGAGKVRLGRSAVLAARLHRPRLRAPGRGDHQAREPVGERGDRVAAARRLFRQPEQCRERTRERRAQPHARSVAQHGDDVPAALAV